MPDTTADRPPSIDPGRLALSRSVLDRAADRRRDDAWLARAWARSDTQVVTVADSRIAVSTEGQRLAFVAPRQAPSGDRVFLGVDREAGAGRATDGRAVFGILLAASDDQAGGHRFATLREAGGLLDDREAGIAVHLIGLANWHATHPCCARCGVATEIVQAGHVRRCPACSAEHFPRSDPAVIVLVTDDADRALLGRGADWPPGRYSTLAGFVEPGESLEAAVRREVLEETAVVVGNDIRYAGSQPWPFPSSLMLGFYARAVTTGIAVDGDEISDARWFTRTDLREAIDAVDVRLPGPVSISRRLIEGWYGAELSGRW